MSVATGGPLLIRLGDVCASQSGVMIAAMAAKGMWRMIGRQVRSRRDRSIALGAGILVASVSFSLLTAAAATSQLEVHGVVDAASRPAYDILVRPKGADTSFAWCQPRARILRLRKSHNS